jgi:hypothetical protein
MCQIFNGCGATAVWGWRVLARIMTSAALLKQERQNDLRRATLTVAKRVENCIEVDGGIFEHLLWTVAIYWDYLHNQ